MMLKIYGSPMWPDCVICKEELDKAGISYVYMDITGNLMFLKKFLKLREQPVFAQIREKGQIGIPCILREDDSITFDWKEFL
jgi:glutaredoxin-related protein